MYTLSPRNDQGGGQSLEVWAGMLAHACPVPSGWDLKDEREDADPGTSVCMLASGTLDAQGVDHSELLRARLELATLS